MFFFPWTLGLLLGFFGGNIFMMRLIKNKFIKIYGWTESIWNDFIDKNEKVDLEP